MTNVEAAWEQVSENFAALGRRLNEHFEAAVAAGEPADLSQIEEALDTVADALERAVGAVGDSLRSVQAHAEARQAVRALSEALHATFGEVGHEILPLRDHVLV